jgi:hypothetical protein
LALKIVNYYAINVFHQSNFRISRMYRYATLREAHVKRLACSEKRTEIHQPLAQRRMLGQSAISLRGPNLTKPDIAAAIAKRPVSAELTIVRDTILSALARLSAAQSAEDGDPGAEPRSTTEATP